MGGGGDSPLFRTRDVIKGHVTFMLSPFHQKIFYKGWVSHILKYRMKQLRRSAPDFIPLGIFYACWWGVYIFGSKYLEAQEHATHDPAYEKHH